MLGLPGGELRVSKNCGPALIVSGGSFNDVGLDGGDLLVHPGIRQGRLPQLSPTCTGLGAEGGVLWSGGGAKQCQALDDHVEQEEQRQGISSEISKVSRMPFRCSQTEPYTTKLMAAASAKAPVAALAMS